MFARAIVAARFPIMVGWVAAAVVMALTLPTLREAQTGALGQLVPAGSRALEAEELSATSFRFPLSSRTVVVERDASGLSPERVANGASRQTAACSQVSSGARGSRSDRPGTAAG